MRFLWDVLIGLGALAALGIAILIWLALPYGFWRRSKHTARPVPEIPRADDDLSAPTAPWTPSLMPGRRNWYWCGYCQGEPCWRCVQMKQGR